MSDIWFPIFIGFACLIWCTLSLSSIATELGHIERNSKRTADALELLAKAANIKRGA
jgi:hypothetical protein